MENLSEAAIWMTIVFFIGYALITLEHIIHIDKAATALMMGVVAWIIEFTDINSEHTVNIASLGEHLSSISQIILFLLGALTIVEIISTHKGFQVIAQQITTHSKRKLLWIIGFLSFFLSSIIDNLTTTIVMITFLQKIIEEREDRILIGGGIVIAANAGGAWTPIGDVTTTMLWIGERLSSFGIIQSLFLPSLACMIVSFICLHFMLKGNFHPPKNNTKIEKEPLSQFILYTGIALLIFVPIFKMLTNLPPFMGILFGLSILWIITDLAHKRYHERSHLRVPFVLSKVDITAIMFFLGILLCVDALDTQGILTHTAEYLDKQIQNETLIATTIGLISAIVDNVPLVAASMGMYDYAKFPIDHNFWKLIAFCAGTGGSILIIGSAAGVVYMSLERVDFFWYLRRISLPALLGYLAGIGVYLLY